VVSEFCLVRAVSIVTASLVRDPDTPALYALSLHDALPIYRARAARRGELRGGRAAAPLRGQPGGSAGAHAPGDHDAGAARRRHRDRKSTRLNSSHSQNSYAVFCLKKKNQNKKQTLEVSTKQ